MLILSISSFLTLFQFGCRTSKLNFVLYLAEGMYKCYIKNKINVVSDFEALSLFLPPLSLSLYILRIYHYTLKNNDIELNKYLLSLKPIIRGRMLKFVPSNGKNNINFYSKHSKSGHLKLIGNIQISYKRYLSLVL